MGKGLSPSRITPSSDTRRAHGRGLQLERDDRAPLHLVGEGDPERAFYDSFVDDEISRAIDLLPEEYRAAVVLSDIHVLGVPEGTVKIAALPRPTNSAR